MKAIYHPGYQYTDDEILHNRRVVTQYLQQPELKKATGVLGNIKTGGRCCLGHMCDALGVPSVEFGNVLIYDGKERYDLPKPAQEALGMYSGKGVFRYREVHGTSVTVPRISKRVDSLIDLNDSTRISPQSIGKFLSTIVMGGDNTPWKEIKTV